MSPSIMFRHLVVGVALLAAADLGAVVNAPTEQEWAPFAGPVTSGDLAIRERLLTFLTGRNWADGWVLLANLDIKAEDFAACHEHALLAWQILVQEEKAFRVGEVTSQLRRRLMADAAAQVILSANRLGKPAVGSQQFAAFGERPDHAGWVHFHASESARQQKDLDLALTILGRAKKRSGATTPPDFWFLEGQIHEDYVAVHEEAGKQDLALESMQASAAGFELGCKGQPDNLDGRYKLAVMQRRLAHAIPAERESYLRKAADSFTAITTHQRGSNDAQAYLGLALVRLDQGQWTEAVHVFDAAIPRLESLPERDPAAQATAHRGRGTARLMLAEENTGEWTHDKALEDLEQAQTLGDSSPELFNNLLVALLAVQRQERDPARKQDLQKRIDALDKEDAAVDPVNRAMAYFRKANDFLQRLGDGAKADRTAEIEAALKQVGSAIDLLSHHLGTRWLPSNGGDWSRPADTMTEPRPAAWRFLGHACLVQSRLIARHAQSAGLNPEKEVAQAQEMARSAWTVAGDLRDKLSRTHYLALETARGSPRLGLDAGLRYLRWTNWLGPSGWWAVASNYGSSGIWRQQLHLVVWGALAGLPLIIGVWLFVANRPRKAPPRRTKTEKTGRESKDARRPSTTQRRKSTAVGDGGQTAPPAGPPGAAPDVRSDTLLPDTEIDRSQGALEHHDQAERKAQVKASNEPSADPAQKAIADVEKRLERERSTRRAGPAPTRRRH